MKKETVQKLRSLIREEVSKMLNEKYKPFSELEFAIKHHENDNDLYYDTTRLKTIFNQLTARDQEKARKKYSKYFGK